MPRRLLSAAAVCTLVLGLAACGEGGKGTVTDPPPSIDISMPSDGGGEPSDGGGDGEPTAAPDVPAPDPADYPGIDEKTAEGAEQFTRYFFALMIWGYQTGESEELESLYSETCGICEANVENIRAYGQEGVAWTEASIDGITTSPLDVVAEEFDRAVHYEAVVGEHDEPDVQSGEYESVPALTYTLQLGLRWTSEGWIADGAALDAVAA